MVAGVTLAVPLQGFAAAGNSASEERPGVESGTHAALLVNRAHRCFEPHHAALLTNALRHRITLTIQDIQSWCGASRAAA